MLKAERRPQPGETVTGAKLLVHPGGKGANQAAGAALLGARVTLLGRVGTDAFGGDLVRNLQGKGVETTWVEASPNTPTGAAFITVTPDGENAITVAPGANLHLTPNDVDGASEYIGRARVLVRRWRYRRKRCVVRWRLRTTTEPVWGCPSPRLRSSPDTSSDC